MNFVGICHQHHTSPNPSPLKIKMKHTRINHFTSLSSQQLFIHPRDTGCCVRQYILLSNQPHSQNVHCNDSLAWFKSSSLLHTIITGLSLKLLLDILLLPQVSYSSTGPDTSGASAGHRCVIRYCGPVEGPGCGSV